MDAAGNVVATTTTDSNGSYVFDNLLPGDYVVEFIPPASLPVSSGPTDTMDNGQDDDDNGIQQDTNGDGITDGPITSPVISLMPGTEPTNEPGINGNKGAAADEDGDNTIDFGLIACLEISGEAFLDSNVNGCKDVNEATIADVDVELFACDANGDPINGGAAVGTTTTDANGEYLFDESNSECLIPGASYFVQFDIPEGHIATEQDVCGDPDDSDIDETGQTECVDPSDEDESDNLDGGFVPLMSIGSTVFSDDNNNGVLDPGEQTIGQKGKTITLTLLDAAGNVVATTTTDSDGSYEFNNLVPGDYIVEFLPPVSSPVSSTGSAPDDGVDGDDNGIQQDTDGDGLTDGVIQSALIVLAPGTEPTNEPAIHGNKGAAADNNSDNTIDFGLVSLGSIGSTVFSDDNNNGIQDPGEENIGDKGKTCLLYTSPSPRDRG